MPVLEHDHFAGNAAFLAPSNKGITKFVRVIFGKQPLERGAQGIDVDVLCLLEVYEVLYLFEHRGKWYVPQGGTFLPMRSLLVSHSRVLPSMIFKVGSSLCRSPK